jgi:hypothetical protein
MAVSWNLQFVVPQGFLKPSSARVPTKFWNPWWWQTIVGPPTATFVTRGCRRR